MKLIISFLAGLLLCLQTGLAPAAPSPDEALDEALDEEDLTWLGQQIFQNECASRFTCLTSWNEGEDFPSFGIGHFIWYREGQQEIYRESFPHLLRYLRQHGTTLPDWVVDHDFEQPWADRDSFLADLEGEELSSLRQVLAATMALQTRFIIERFLEAQTQVLDNDAPGASERLAKLEALSLASPPYGIYALIDYVNFKGSGIDPAERYQGQGWGLAQVLDRMSDDEAFTLQAFVAAAESVLEARVHNAPPARDEQRWLPGWKKRLQTYLPDST